MKMIPGAEIVVGPRGRQIIFQKDLSLDAFASLLSSMMENGTEFAFFDTDYPSPSDPGAYFNYSPRGGEWRMSLGNHGWSGGIYVIETEVVCRQLQKLNSKGALEALTIDGVLFARHYKPETPLQNQEMNARLKEIHR